MTMRTLGGTHFFRLKIAGVKLYFAIAIAASADNKIIEWLIHLREGETYGKDLHKASGRTTTRACRQCHFQMGNDSREQSARASPRTTVTWTVSAAR